MQAAAARVPKAALGELHSSPAAVLLHKLVLTLYSAGSWHSWGGFISAADSRGRLGATAGDRAAQSSPASQAGT